MLPESYHCCAVSTQIEVVPLDLHAVANQAVLLTAGCNGHWHARCLSTVIRLGSKRNERRYVRWNHE